MSDYNEDHPADVVPKAGITADTLLRLNSAIGQQISHQEPGEIMTDLDGVPIAAEDPTITEATLGGAVVTAAEVKAAGLTPDDIPNIDVIDFP